MVQVWHPPQSEGRFLTVDMSSLVHLISPEPLKVIRCYHTVKRDVHRSPRARLEANKMMLRNLRSNEICYWRTRRGLGAIGAELADMMTISGGGGGSMYLGTQNSAHRASPSPGRKVAVAALLSRRELNQNGERPNCRGDRICHHRQAALNFLETSRRHRDESV